MLPLAQTYPAAPLASWPYACGLRPAGLQRSSLGIRIRFEDVGLVFIVRISTINVTNNDACRVTHGVPCYHTFTFVVRAPVDAGVCYVFGNQCFAGLPRRTADANVCAKC